MKSLFHQDSNDRLLWFLKLTKHMKKCGFSSFHYTGRAASFYYTIRTLPLIIFLFSFFLPWFWERSLLSSIYHDLTAIKLSDFIPIIITHYYLSLFFFLLVALPSIALALLLQIWKFWLVSLGPFWYMYILWKNASSFFWKLSRKNNLYL